MKKKTTKSKHRELELGCKVEDIVTGFEGIVIGITVYLTGCDVIGIKPCALKDGIPQSPQWIDSNQLKVIAGPTSKIAGMLRKKTETGGPRETPPDR